MGGLAPRARRLLLAPAALALAAAAWGGLERIGWEVPLSSPVLVGMHGPLFVCGLFGTLIALERAVALGQAWAYLGVLAGALGTLLALANAQGGAALAFSVAAALLVAACAVVVGRQRAVFTGVMALAAALWLGGNVLWAFGWPLHVVVWWWVGFLVLTIAAERLELARLVRPPAWARRAFPLLVALAVAGLALGRPQVLGAALLALALWLARFDVARRTVRQRGLPRYAAVALLCGYAWLATGGGVLALGPPPFAGPPYDTVLHALFVGFVLSMVFAHAPIILPAVARLDIPFHRALYLPLLVLHGSLVARLVGNVLESPGLRRAGGLGNALALLVFAGCVLFARRQAPARRGARAPRSGEPRTGLS